MSGKICINPKEGLIMLGLLLTCWKTESAPSRAKWHWLNTCCLLAKAVEGKPAGGSHGLELNKMFDSVLVVETWVDLVGGAANVGACCFTQLCYLIPDRFNA
jgi:hypothetical protein